MFVYKKGEKLIIFFLLSISLFKKIRVEDISSILCRTFLKLQVLVDSFAGGSDNQAVM